MSEPNGPVIEVGVRVTAADGSTTSLVAASAAAPTAGGPSVLTRAEAAELTARIGQALEHAEVLIATAYLRRAWEPLGLSSWNSYVEAHFGDRPMLTVPRQDRPEVVRSLSESGLSGRAIARAIGVDEGTVRNDLKQDEGAENSAPEATVEVLCPTCGESHAADVGTCPYLDDAFGTIIDLSEDGQNAVADRRFGPAAQGGNAIPAEAGDHVDDDVDTEDAPLPLDDGADADSEIDADAEAARRTRRLRSGVDRVTVLRDDLDELPQLLNDMTRDLDHWPDTAASPPPADLAGRLRDQIAAVRTALPEVAGWLTAAEGLAGTLEEMAR